MKNFLATLCGLALFALFAIPLILIAAPVWLLFGTALYGSWVVFGAVLFLSWSIRCCLSFLKSKVTSVKVLALPTVVCQGDSV